MNDPTSDASVPSLRTHLHTQVETVLGLCWQDLSAILGLGVVGLLLMVWPDDPTAIFGSPRNTRDQSAVYSPPRIDVNSATIDELQLLAGVGVKLAQRIVEDRERNGPIDDLDRIHGIGPKLIARNHRFAQVSKRTTTTH